MTLPHSRLPVLLLLLLSLLPAAHAISQQSRRVQTTFALLTNTTTCARSITHARIATFRNIDPAAPSRALDGFLWDTLLLASVRCQATLSDRARQSTYLRPLPTSPPGVAPDAAQPFFLQGRDNSPRRCAAFNASFPATYLFTDDLPTFRDRFLRQGLLDPGLADRAFRGDVYMFAVPASVQADVVGRACAYVELDDEPLATGEPLLSDMPACFPASALVATPYGARAMRDIRIGHRVTVPGGVDEVLSFTHAEPVTAEYLALRTINASLTLSSGHLLYVNGRLRHAAAVSIGDVLTGTSGPMRVTSVQTVNQFGLYAPVTSSGVMFVDGFLVSCYTDVLGHFAAHALLTPVRAVSKVVSWDCCRLVDVIRESLWSSLV